MSCRTVGGKALPLRLAFCRFGRRPEPFEHPGPDLVARLAVGGELGLARSRPGPWGRGSASIRPPDGDSASVPAPCRWLAGDSATIRSNCDRSSPHSCISSKTARAVAATVRSPVSLQTATEKPSISMSLLHARRLHIGALAVHLSSSAPRPSASGRRCGRSRTAPTWGNLPTRQPQCRTQIRVKSRRAVSMSTTALPSSRSCSTRAPSLWMPRRAMSMASIWLGGRRLTASK